MSFMFEHWFEDEPADITRGELKRMVEVVLCRDCMWRGNRWTGCPKLKGLVTPDDFFCKYGKPKENA